MGLSFINLQIKEKLKNISNNVILEEFVYVGKESGGFFNRQ